MGPLVTLYLSVHYSEFAPAIRRQHPVAAVLQQSNADVYLNGAKRIASGNFVRARGEESGILNDDAENNTFCGAPGVGGNLAEGHPAQPAHDSQTGGVVAKNSGGGEVERLRAGRRADREGAAEGRDRMVRRDLRERRRGTARGRHPQTDSDVDGILAGGRKTADTK